jgi:hypothetical protein
MRPARFGLWCCLLLLFAGSTTTAYATISDEGKRAIEQLRQRHQNAEAEPARSRMRDLTEQLRRKHKSNEEPDTPQTSMVPIATPVKTVEPPRPVAEVEPPVVAAGEQAVESPSVTQVPVYDTSGDGRIMAEKYDHVPYPSAPEKKPQAAAPFQQKQITSSDDAGFSGFIVAVLAVITLFSLGSAFAVGTLMLLGAIVVGGVAMVKFWPFVLLLMFGAMFSQSGRSANDSGCCGCGCGLILLLLLLGIL